MIPTHIISTTRQGTAVYTGRIVQIDFIKPMEQDLSMGAMVTAILYDNDPGADFRHQDIVAVTAFSDGTPLSVEVPRYGVKLVTRQGGGIKQTICELTGAFS